MPRSHLTELALPFEAILSARRADGRSDHGEYFSGCAWRQRCPGGGGNIKMSIASTGRAADAIPLPAYESDRRRSRGMLHPCRAVVEQLRQRNQYCRGRPGTSRGTLQVAGGSTA